MRYVRFVPAALAAASLMMFVSLGRAEAPAKPATGTSMITGKVTDPAGKPAAGVKVTLYASAATAKPAPTADAPAGKKKAGKAKAVANVMTGDDGSFKFDNLAAGDYTLTAKSKLGIASAHLSIKDGEAKDVQLALAKRTKKAQD